MRRGGSRASAMTCISMIRSMQPPSEAGLLHTVPLSLGQQALISSRHQHFSKATAHQGLVSCLLPMLLIRGCWALKAQLGSSCLGLLGTPWDGFKGRKAICSFCAEATGFGEGVLLLVGELIRPSECLATSQVT